MTTEQARDLLYDLLVWRMAHTGSPVTSVAVTDDGELTFTATDGTAAVIAIATTPAEGGQP